MSNPAGPAPLAEARVRALAKGSLPLTFTPIPITVGPRTYRGVLKGIHFETEKSFILPSAMVGMRHLRCYYAQRHPSAQVLVVGHTDRAGADAYNLTLSVERADSVAAYLRDDVPAWLAWYDASKPALKRWGDHEDQLMIGEVAPRGTGAAGSRAAIERFQRQANATQGTTLPTTGVMDTATRTELIREYMLLDGTTLIPAVLLTHGCGEFHNAVPTSDGVAKDENRRVEVFFFEPAIDPSPVAPCPSPGCSEYALWTAPGTLVETIDLESGAPACATGDLVVRVLESTMDAPIEGADVVVRGGLNPERRALTGPDGIATFADTPAGDYVVDAARAGFTPRSGPVSLHAPGLSTSAATVRLTSVAKVELVTDATGDFTIDGTDPVATFVRMGLWDNAFDASGNVLRSDTPADDFVSADSRRFYIRITDPMRAPGTTPANFRALKADLTNNDARAVESVTLTETAAGSHIFASQALMLATDDDDRDVTTRTGLPAPDNVDRGRGAADHRIRPATMTGQVEAEYAPASGGTTLRVRLPVFERAPESRRRVALQIYVMRVAAGGAPAIATGAASALWTRDVRVLRETYERFGMHVEITVDPAIPAADVVTVGADSIGEIDPPAGVASVAAVTPAEQPAIATAFPGLANTIRVFYVGGLSSGNRAESWDDGIGLAAADVRLGSSYINSSTDDAYNVAHEVGHHLWPKPQSSAVGGAHYVRNAAPAGNRLFTSQNLMRNGTTRWEGEASSKRIWDANDADGSNQIVMRTSRFTRGF